MKIKYEFTNEIQDDGSTVLTLAGRVSPYGEDCISAKKVREALDEVSGDITIRLNSGGGDVFEGIEIYNYLKDLPNYVTVEVTGLAGSAASLIAVGADEVVMCTGSQFMIHEASTIAIGTKADIQKTLGALETVDESLINIYHEKTERDKVKIADWIKDETWFTAEEAVAAGLADRVKSKREEELENQIKQLTNERIVASNPPVGLQKLFGGK